jgi:ABC-type Na+ transport system ATPase subunit NatA
MPQPTRAPAIHVSAQGLRFAYAHEQTPVFDDFNWQVAQGEMWALVGPSGCGKTTLLYLMVGLGYYILVKSWGSAADPEMHAGVVMLSMLGLALYYVADWLERRLAPWKFLAA